jgi:alkylation response protein AidB-like acyl-CoA dehydrogenase
MTAVLGPEMHERASYPDAESRAAGQWLVAACAAGALDLPQPGSGRTHERFGRLARLGEVDLVRARLGEGHADAVAILRELDGPVPEPHVWGVWAARPDSLRARLVDGAWTLTGERAWCSGAGTCTRALVTARADDGVRLFAVDPSDPGAVALAGTWSAVGMAASDTRTMRFTAVPALPVGDPGAYTDRPGFWHGGIGVAACWYGGAVGVARTLLPAVGDDPHALAHLGAVDAALGSARAMLTRAAAEIDADPVRDVTHRARQVRAVVEQVATEVLARVGRALGAGPLGHDRAHARRVADLTVYLRQGHAERDLAELGSLVAAQLDPAWELT